MWFLIRLLYSIEQALSLPSKEEIMHEWNEKMKNVKCVILDLRTIISCWIFSIDLCRYRKYHLAGDRGIQKPSKVDVVSFETDFGVTFGVFICFDIFFKQPMNTLLNQGVTHFVFPTFWFNELPYLSGEIDI